MIKSYKLFLENNNSQEIIQNVKDILLELTDSEFICDVYIASVPNKNSEENNKLFVSISKDKKINFTLDELNGIKEVLGSLISYMSSTYDYYKICGFKNSYQTPNNFSANSKFVNKINDITITNRIVFSTGTLYNITLSFKYIDYLYINPKSN